MDADISMWALFLKATFIVKLVMIALIAASVWSWSVAITKRRQLRVLRQQDAQFEAQFWSGQPLDQLYDTVRDAAGGGLQRVFCAAMLEWQRNYRSDGGFVPGSAQRIDRAMDVCISREAERLGKGLTVLATIGAITPFVGLFGTVWGIMNAFIEIAAEQNTNLAVVAPGIAEALFATGLGLIAAIPAVIFYNNLSAQTNAIGANYEAFADEFSAILSRQIEV